MLKQNDKKLNQNIRATGCNLRSLQAAAERFSERDLTAAEINKLAEEAVIKGWMRQNCHVLDPGKVAGDAFRALGKSVRCMQIGYYDLVDKVWRDWSHKVIKDVQDCNHFAVAHWTTAVNPTAGHFCLCNTQLVEVFDPWDDAIGGSLGKQDIDRAYLYKLV